MAGWIKLWEIPEDHWLNDDLRYVSAWVQLLQMAERKDRKITRQGQMIEAKRGTIYTSVSELALKWRVSRKFVRHFLEMLEQDGMVQIQQRDNRGYSVKVCNYAKYQDKPDNRRTTEAPTEEQPSVQPRYQPRVQPKPVSSEYSEEGKEYTEGESKGKNARAQRFVPPTIQEVAEYILQNHLKVDPVRFWNYYESNGWMVGKNKMRSWQATLRNWSAKQTEISKPNAKKFDNFEPRPDGDLMDEYIKTLEGRYG